MYLEYDSAKTTKKSSTRIYLFLVPKKRLYQMCYRILIYFKKYYKTSSNEFLFSGVELPMVTCGCGTPKSDKCSISFSLFVL